MFLLKIILVMLEITFTIYALITEDQLLALPSKANQQNAIKLCQEQGMNLIKIQDEQTNQIVYDFAVNRGLGQYWIDGNDRIIEGQWVYEDGNKIIYSKWKKGEPNDRHNEDCVHGSYYRNGFWNDISCDNNNAVICYREKLNTNIESISEDQLLALPSKVNQQNAIKLCQEQGMNLIKIQDEKSNQNVYDFAVNRGIGQYWIDVNDKITEGQWVYEDGIKIIYSKWKSGEPNNRHNEDCVHGSYYRNGFWNDISCDNNNAVICYRLKSDIKPVKIEEKQLSFFLKKVNQQDAVNLCKKYGSNLIKVQNEETNQMIYNYAVKIGLEQYWIDSNDRKNESNWEYENGDRIIYSKWKKGEPNNHRDEDCLHGLYYKNGFWNDISCTSNNSVICYDDVSSIENTTIDTKPDTKTKSFSFFISFESGNYDAAVNFCKGEGLKLLRIDSDETNNRATDLAKSQGYGTFWIDGTDRNSKGNWLDSFDNSLTYKNFKSGIINESTDAHCINGYSFENELWNIAPCDSTHSIVCID